MAHIRALIFEKMAGTISEADNRLLQAAIVENEEAAQLWKDVQEQLSSSKARTVISGMNTDRAWRSVESRLQSGAVRKTTNVYRWSAAAAVLLLIAAGLVYVLPREKEAPLTVQHVTSGGALQLKLPGGRDVQLSATEKDTVAAGNMQLITAANKLTYTVANEQQNDWATLVIPPRLDYKVELKDGTEVWLNALSSLRFPYVFDGNTREVYLTGEAYFKVAPDPQKPFIVHAGSASVQVLGTSFNIDAYNTEEITTSLVEGSVITRAGENSVQLQPGRQSVYRNGRFTTGSFDAATTLSWTSGTSNFHDTRLKQVAAIIHRWYDVRIVFDTPGLEQQKISGAINKHQPLDVFLTNLSLSSGITSQVENGVVHLK